MKPPRFDYLRAGSLDEAVEALVSPGAMVLAGGQSLLLELAYRQVRPRLLVDINAMSGLAGLAADRGGTMRIGALVRHRQLESDDGSGPARRLLAKAAHYVAHPPIRARGTFCGSIAWAHPAAEWNAIALACDARMAVRSTRGVRHVAAGDWYLGPGRSAADPDELLTDVELLAPPGSGTGFAEHRRTHASFAEVAAAAVLSADAGAVDRARIAVVGLHQIPYRAREVEDALIGAEPGAAAEHAAAALAGPADDYHAAVARELVRRAVTEAVGEL